MQKSKLFLIIISVVVLFAASITGVARSAGVTGINKSKGHIHINGGTNDGYIPGNTVCFPVSSVAYGNELVCGTVVSAEASTATVKVSKSRAKKMKVGTEAMLPVEKAAEEEMKDNDMEAQVSEINQREGRVHINGGVDTGYILGITVCFSISLDKKPVCGTIQEAEASKAVVAVSPKEAEMIEIGTAAMLEVAAEAKGKTKKKVDWFR